MPPTIWLTGAGGLIGNYLLQAAAQHAPHLRVIGLTRTRLNLTATATVRSAFQADKPDAVIHCAALSKTAACEADPPLAHKLNVDVAALLAELAADIPFIFLSTDLVFDGRKGNYSEADAVNPLSVYGETKVAAEKIVLANPRHTVIRTSLNAGISPTGDRAFNEEMRRLWREGRMLNLFTDEFRSPIPAVVTARAIWSLLEAKAVGLFHVAGSERLSRWQIGELLAARNPQLHPRIVPGSLKDYPGAPRTPDSSLNCGKAQKLLTFPLPAFSKWLAERPDEQF